MRVRVTSGVRPFTHESRTSVSLLDRNVRTHIVTVPPPRLRALAPHPAVQRGGGDGRCGPLSLRHPPRDRRKATSIDRARWAAQRYRRPSHVRVTDRLRFRAALRYRGAEAEPPCRSLAPRRPAALAPPLLQPSHVRVTSESRPSRILSHLPSSKSRRRYQHTDTRPVAVSRRRSRRRRGLASLPPVSTAGRLPRARPISRARPIRNSRPISRARPIRRARTIRTIA